MRVESKFNVHDAQVIKIDKSVQGSLYGRDDVRRRLRALSCEKSSIIADPKILRNVCSAYSPLVLLTVVLTKGNIDVYLRSARAGINDSL